MEVLHTILFQAPPSLSRLNPAIPSSLENVILRMLEKEAARRPSASEVEQILAKLAAGLCEPTSVTVAPSPPGHTVGREKEHAENRASAKPLLSKTS